LQPLSFSMTTQRLIAIFIISLASSSALANDDQEKKGSQSPGSLDHYDAAAYSKPEAARWARLMLGNLEKLERRLERTGKSEQGKAMLPLSYFDLIYSPYDGPPGYNLLIGPHGKRWEPGRMHVDSAIINSADLTHFLAQYLQGNGKRFDPKLPTCLVVCNAARSLPFFRSTASRLSLEFSKRGWNHQVIAPIELGWTKANTQEIGHASYHVAKNYPVPSAPFPSKELFHRPTAETLLRTNMWRLYRRGRVIPYKAGR
jgi:hypothetical protein